MVFDRIRDIASAAIAHGRGAIGSLMVLAKEKGGPMIGWLLSPLGRVAGTVAIAAVAWFAFAKHYEHKGASRVVAKLEEKANANVKKADAARKSVSNLPVDGLLDSYRRD